MTGGYSNLPPGGMGPLDPTDVRFEEETSSCPVCGEPIDYCQGHGEIGDPFGAAILADHDDGKHEQCHPAGCPDAPRDPIEVYGTPEHEAWLIEMERQEG